MYACCILHNMIIENEDDDKYKLLDLGNMLERGFTWEDGTEEIIDTDAHYDLRDDLAEHLWQVKGCNTYEC